MFEGGVSATVQLEDWKKSLEIKELDRTLLAPSNILSNEQDFTLNGKA